VGGRHFLRNENEGHGVKRDAGKNEKEKKKNKGGFGRQYRLKELSYQKEEKGSNLLRKANGKGERRKKV